MRRWLLMSWLVVLALPAAAQAAPPNDDRAAATQLAPLPAQVKGTTVGATVAAKDPRVCAPLDASVWYRIDGAPAGDIVLRLKAGGKLDAAVAVFRSVRSELRTVDCARTNDKGAADVSFRASKGDSFLILIGQRRDSAPGDFQLVAFLAEPPATAPGDRLPASGAHGTLNALGDRDDAWWFVMQPAQTYRIRVIALHHLCVTADVYSSRGRSFGGEVASVGCPGYRLFTPGAGAGGRYSLVVHADTGAEADKVQGYRVYVAPAAPDDMGPGVPLANGGRVAGRVSALGIDVQDLYRFDVLRRGNATLSLVDRPGAQLDLLVLNAAGRTVGCACNGTGPAKVSQQIAPGRYFVLVRAREHSRSTYTLSLLLRDLTTTSLSVSPAQTSPGGSVTLSVRVSSSGGGQAQIEVERFDILQGWVFARLFHVSLGSGGSAAVSWRPPTIGRWRARASFLGTSSASPSESGYASFVVG